MHNNLLSLASYLSIKSLIPLSIYLVLVVIVGVPRLGGIHFLKKKKKKSPTILWGTCRETSRKHPDQMLEKVQLAQCEKSRGSSTSDCFWKPGYIQSHDFGEGWKLWINPVFWQHHSVRLYFEPTPRPQSTCGTNSHLQRHLHLLYLVLTQISHT